MGIFGLKSSRHFTRELSITPPEPRVGRKGIAIVACVKNEIDYIVEWIRFHQAVGVGHFILYDDQSTDGTFLLLKRILSERELTVVPWSMHMTYGHDGRVMNGQVIAFAHAISNFGGSFQRMAFIDVDEFLLPKSGGTLQEALLSWGDFPNISLPWHMFGHSGHEKRPSDPVTTAYTKRAHDPMKRHAHAMNFKCIVDPTEVTQVSVHHFHTRSNGDVTSNDSGVLASYRDRKRPEFYSAQNIQLNHYYSKSHDEFRLKIERGWSYDQSTEKYAEKARSIRDHVESEQIEDLAMRKFVQSNRIELSRRDAASSAF